MLNYDDVLDYTDWQRDAWHGWFTLTPIATLLRLQGMKVDSHDFLRSR